MKLIIIGAGPGGYETALIAAERGVEVILIESSHVGGTCLNEGCIPTKSFCKNAEVLDGLKEASAFGISSLTYDFDFNSVIERKNTVVDQLRKGVESLLGHKLITLVYGKASFKNENTVIVQLSEGGETEYEADYIIVATGSVSASLPIPGAELPGILTSKEILDIEEVPQRLCVIGGGVIGLEFASVFCSFGSQVTVIEYFKDILPRFDTDLSKRLKQSLSRRGIEICTQSQVLSIEEAGGGYKITYSRKGKEDVVYADKVLMAVGRRANIDSMNFSDIGLEFTPKGITVNDVMQTNIPHIYAIGDINGKMMLAHAAIFQGIVALDNIMGVENGIDLSVMPAAVFTSPEAASVGMTEDECKAQGLSVKCLKSFFRANGKAVTMNDTDGFCKVIISDSGHILGCHLYGPHASDLIQEVCALMTHKASLEDFQSVIHTHPTLSEVLQSAVSAR